MRVVNVHERTLRADLPKVGALIDTLSSQRDGLWPAECWPRMELDGPLVVGVSGGHGPIRYSIDSRRPGHSIRFRFQAPRGFHGFHGYEVVALETRQVLLRHTLEMSAIGMGLLSWAVVFRPLHDALIEDSLAVAQASLGLQPEVRRWSLWVRFLRWIASRGKAGPQVVPKGLASA